MLDTASEALPANVPRPSRLTARRDGDGHVEVRVEGELDRSAVPSLEAALGDAETDGHRARVDLADCELIDLSVLQVLVAAHRALTARGGELLLEGPRGQVERLLAASGVARILKGGTERQP